ncbi:abscission/NoCut checkpoint regulator [Bradysia coprophila]|uniref:abscission/NoCut checkpoint regulator n=1 Tax=Bradysia coprophila TaxID=38358 RepID=UPI00187DB1C9|nr:abscission/NoCut checkpoint regulator [Bradysia coprophila]
MSCNACSKSYGFFCKEIGCPSCGFSFCSKCLKKSLALPKFKGAEKKVCLSCYDKYTKNQLSSSDEPMEIDPAVISPMDAPIPAEAQTDLDEVIRNRLISLKEDRLNSKTNSQSFADIAIRVSNLKGIAHKEHSNKDILLNMDTRTDEEKTRDLVKQFLEERSLDEQSDPIKDIERRLAALKGCSSSDDMKADANKESDSDDETKVKKLVSKYLDEAALPDANIELTPEEQEFVKNAEGKKDKDLEELPWCTICNEDAELRYQGDLFCKQCYKEIKEEDDG